MKIIRVELLEREITASGRCYGTVRMHLKGGDMVTVTCDIRYTGVGGLSALNGYFAEEALRKFRRLPEYANAPLEVAKYAMPPVPHMACEARA